MDCVAGWRRGAQRPSSACFGFLAPAFRTHQDDVGHALAVNALHVPSRANGFLRGRQLTVAMPAPPPACRAYCLYSTMTLRSEVLLTLTSLMLTSCCLQKTLGHLEKFARLSRFCNFRRIDRIVIISRRSRRARDHGRTSAPHSSCLHEQLAEFDLDAVVRIDLELAPASIADVASNMTANTLMVK